MSEQRYTIKALTWDQYGSEGDLIEVHLVKVASGFEWWIEPGSESIKSSGVGRTEAEVRAQAEAAYREIVAQLLVPVEE